MSASFPIGAYTCSHGLETAIQDGRLHDVESCREWVSTIMRYGSGWNDAVILNEAFRLVASQDDDMQSLSELNRLSLALQAGAERVHETTTLATSFIGAASHWPQSRQMDWSVVADPPDNSLSLPVVAGALGALNGIPKLPLIATSMQSTMSNLVWIAARLVPLGQNQSVSIIAQLEADCEALSTRAAASSIEALGSCALIADIASLQHETLNGRVCRT